MTQGDRAINQCVKAIAISNVWLNAEGIYIECKPSLERLGAMRFQIYTGPLKPKKGKENCTPNLMRVASTSSRVLFVAVDGCSC